MPDKSLCPGGEHFYKEHKEFKNETKGTLKEQEKRIQNNELCIGKLNMSKKWFIGILTTIFLVFGAVGVSRLYRVVFVADSAPYVFADDRKNEEAHKKIEVTLTKHDKDIEIFAKVGMENRDNVKANTNAIINLETKLSTQMKDEFKKQTTIILEAINKEKSGK